MATKSFIKTIGEKGLLADYNTEGKKLQTELIAGDNVTIDGNTISSDPKVFCAIYGSTTFNEVKEAYAAGKAIFCETYNLSTITSNTIVFSRIRKNGNEGLLNEYYLYDNNIWQKSSTLIFQKKLTFDTTPTAGSTNPVTSDGIRTMKPLSHRFDNETSSRLIVWGKPNNEGYISDIVRKFGLQYGSMTDFLFTNSIHKDNTTSVILKILNDSGIPTTSTKRLKASIFKDSSENLYFALWLDGSISQPGWAYYADYYPDVSEDNRTVRHFTLFNPSEYTLVRNLTIKYIPLAVPTPSAGVLTSDGSSNSWLTPPASGTAVLKSVNGVIQWVTE